MIPPRMHSIVFVPGRNVSVVYIVVKVNTGLSILCLLGLINLLQGTVLAIIFVDNGDIGLVVVIVDLRP